MESLRVVALIVGSWTAAASADNEWQPVSDGEVRALLKVAETALDSQWDRSRRGWCRAILESEGDQRPFSFWWDGDRIGLEFEQVVGDDVRDLKTPLAARRVVLYLPNEHWFYYPEHQACRGLWGAHLMPMPQELDIRPHRIWLTMLDGQNPKLRHLDRLWDARIDEDSLEVSRSNLGLVRFETSKLRLVFDPARGFSPVRAEFQTNLNEAPRPELMLPIVEEYNLAQDAHAKWYCNQMVRTCWPRGGKGDPWTIHSPMIVEYDSQPEPEQLRLSFDDLHLPPGTRVGSHVPSRLGNWVVGQENQKAAPPIEK
jgi:hypothetical protein